MNTFHKHLCTWLLACATASLYGSTTDSLTNQLITYASRLNLFGKSLPQEKVYVHLDNTCYFLGDTIWYAAYTRRSDCNLPSNVSRVLYAELYNQDGYLVERQTVKMEQGKGFGQFALPDTLYSGYYELRAYTRWQLNWGVYQHAHSSYSEQWFITPRMAEEYYRDYDKLYSRVFPIYDRPQEAGSFSRDMTLRPLARYFKKDMDVPKLQLTLYPEGGNLIAGTVSHVAFEAATNKGEWKTGRVGVFNKKRELVASATTDNRGRGSFVFTPVKGEEYEAIFTEQGNPNVGKDSIAIAQLPQALTDGAAMHIEQKEDDWCISIHTQGTASTQPLGLTVSYQGLVLHYAIISSADSTICIDRRKLPAGVIQATVYDAAGQILADRLFFSSQQEQTQPTLTLSGVANLYAPYEKIEFDVKAQKELKSSAQRKNTVSIAVRDAQTNDRTYDTGNILTEMLLASEIKGFVPQPDWYFEADDAEHRRALDLLMLTQGWRRFDWHTMAIPKAFAMTQPAEYTPILTGEVNRYSAFDKEDTYTSMNIQATNEAMNDNGKSDTPQETDKFGAPANEAIASIPSNAVGTASQNDETTNTTPAPSGDSNYGSDLDGFYHGKRGMKREVLVHAEFTQIGSDGIIGEGTTENGLFSLPTPEFEGACVLFLGASDTTKWKKGKPHQWIVAKEEDYPEFSVKLTLPYPRFVKPYHHYQMQKIELQIDSGTTKLDEKTVLLQDVSVHTRHGGLRHINANKPAFVVDAYEAFNACIDAGLSVANFSGLSRFTSGLSRTYIGDMNLDRRHQDSLRYDNFGFESQMSPYIRNQFNELKNLDMIKIYTDYSPRNEGSERYKGDNQPLVTIWIHRMPNDTKRYTYRDRRFILHGFATAQEFYHPNYERDKPDAKTADYRRTLYWNPSLELNEEGTAHVTLFNNSRTTSISIEAEGIANDGTLLYNH